MIWPKDEFTRFEVARILGARSLQISLGAPILVKGNENDPLSVAKDEFRSKMIPITIKRQMPDKTSIAVDSKTAIDKWIALNNGEV